MIDRDSGEEWLLEGLAASREPAQPPAIEEPTESQLAAEEARHRWCVEQMVRCNAIEGRKRMVMYLYQQGTRIDAGNEIPEDVVETVDAIVAMYEAKLPDSAPEMHPAFAERHYMELQREVRRRESRGRQ